MRGWIEISETGTRSTGVVVRYSSTVQFYIPTQHANKRVQRRVTRIDCFAMNLLPLFVCLCRIMTDHKMILRNPKIVKCQWVVYQYGPCHKVRL